MINRKFCFVHEINNIDENYKEVVLFIENYDKKEKVKASGEIIKVKNEIILKNEIEEGHFVIYINQNGENLLYRAGSKKYAKRIIMRNNSLRGSIIKKYISPKLSKQPTDKNINYLNTFHINVGHGNCTFLAFFENGIFNLWAIDCSNYDFLTNRNYNDNIEKCISFIKKLYKINSIKFNKLLITHFHYDHISGVDYLIKNKYIDKNTEVWGNFKYSLPEGKRTNDILKLLKNKVENFIEPISLNSLNNIKILYPNVTIYRTKPKDKYKENSIGYVTMNKINNSSVLYLINFKNKRILFTGDIEEQAWKRVDLFDFNILKPLSYYCISHHGSNNGHIRNICEQMDLNNYITEETKKILMGRDGSYNGIFDKEVLTDFEINRILAGEDNSNKNISYIMINWDNSKANIVFNS